MKRRIWLLLLVLYVAAGITDGAYRLANPSPAGLHSSTVATLAVAFCAGLFWPIDVVARQLL